MQKLNALFVSNTLFILVLVHAGGVNAQVALPAAYSSTMPVNFVRTWQAKAPEISPNALMTRPLRDVVQSTSYFDGLGRPIQTVIKQGSLPTGGTPTDMVSSNLYDTYGREQYKYLPFAANNTGGNTSISDGLFKLNPFQQQAVFYNSQLTGQAGETNLGANNLNWAYSKVFFEGSPMNRVWNTYAPGVSWVGSESNADPVARRDIQTMYLVNTATDDVKKWDVSDVPGGWGTVATTAAYAAGALYKTISIDEAGNQVIEFKDKEEKVILKKVQLLPTASDNGTGSNYTGWLCTFYVYDNLNNLRCVIQPEAVKNMSNSGSWDITAYLDGQCFRYEYDQRNRMIRKKVPDAGEVYMVYNTLDLLVMTQDANQRTSNNWVVTKYDALDRPVETGIWTSTISFAAHLFAAKDISNYPVTSSGYQALTITHYDDYNGLPSGLAAFNNTWNNDGTFQQTDNSGWPYFQNFGSTGGESKLTMGAATWTQTRILGTATFLNSVTYYDDKGKVIQTQSTNITGGTDIASIEYSWAGQPLYTVTQQQKLGAGAQTTVVTTKITYDDLGRLLKTEKRQSNTLVNSNAMSTYKIIVQHEYDKLGQLKIKTLSPTGGSGGSALETLQYDYNIRGWLLGINRDYARDISNTNWFGMDLGYDKQNNNLIGGLSYNNQQYNGNIEGTVWKSRGDGEKRKYDFVYDKANRLLRADFGQYSGSAFDLSAGVDYKMKMGDGVDVTNAYDYNGNIKQMQQWGLKLNASPQIDNLIYQTQANSNKLQRVTDGITVDNKLGDFKDGTNTGTDDYSYDVNGNLILDNNKNISSITYNYLNLPSVITVSGKGTITYTYDAAGNKLRKVTVENTITTTTVYMSGAVYTNDVLQFFSHEEGRIRFNPPAGSIPASFAYDYFIKDHLGNVRAMLTDEQKVDAYPAATLEPASISTESTWYGNLTNTQYAKPGWFSDPGYTTNTKIARTKNAAGLQKIGPNIILKVMAGDTYSIRVASGWNSASTVTNSTTNVLNDLFTLLTNAVAGVNSGKATLAELQSGSSGINAGLTSFLSNQTTTGTKPKAYINWVLLDEQFKVAKDASGNMIAPGYSGFEQVGASGSATIHTQASLPVNKSGYLYIYTSNEATNIDVYFDNLQLTHTRGPLLEETHYYPFGLVMQGISSKAANTLENKRKFNQGTELNTDFDLGLYETPFRAYDPQTGHFNQIDPYADAFMDWTPYNYSLNNPISLNDPTGLTPGFPDDKRRNVLPEVIVRPSVRYMNASQRDAFWAKNSHWVNGQRVLGKISYYDNETQRYLSEYNQMQIRGDAFNKVYGKVVLNVAVAAVPWGKVFQGFGWAYRAAKGSQLVSRLGGRFLTELSKEILNNRGNIKEVDMFDVMTNTLLAGKGGIFGKIGVEGLNALVDIKSTAISIYGLKNGYGKMGNEVGLDLMFSGVKLFAGGALEGLGMNGSGLNAYDVVLDQGKKTISDAAAEQ